MPRQTDRLWGLLPHAFALVLLVALFVRVLQLNDGRFTYSIDDPYIHLALSENIAAGHYGLNAAEPSAPASSIAWPYLMATGAAFAVHEYWPLAVNVLSLLVCVALLNRILEEAGLAVSGRTRAWRAGWIVLLILFLNLGGVVFTGMEHAPAIALALACVLGLIHESKDGRSGLLVAAVLLGPLFRYENAAFSLAALVYLAIRSRWRLALLLGAGCTLLVGGFSLYLHGMGLPFLPSSVMTKSQVVSSSGVAAVASSLWQGFLVTARNPQGQFLLQIGVLLLVKLGFERRREEAALLVAGLVFVLAHALVGRYGWFGRYEVYVLAGAFALLLYTYRGMVLWVAERCPAWIGLPVVAGILYLDVDGLLQTTRRTPQACHNIYQQQYQLHRVALAYGEDVAANDVGWVAYRNPSHVLDLYGISSERTRALRYSDDPDWLGDLVEERGIGMAMLFEEWYAKVIPESWVLVGRLRLQGWRILRAPRVVSFYATRTEARERVRAALESVGADLPQDVALEIVEN